jgi:hypothetical protein
VLFRDPGCVQCAEKKTGMPVSGVNTIDWAVGLVELYTQARVGVDWPDIAQVAASPNSLHALSLVHVPDGVVSETVLGGVRVVHGRAVLSGGPARGCSTTASSGQTHRE